MIDISNQNIYDKWENYYVIKIKEIAAVFYEVSVLGG